MFRHLTCGHSYESIRREGFVIPVMQPVLGVELSWWTDAADWIDARALGLESVNLNCNRMQYSFAPLHSEAIMPWGMFANRRRIPMHVRALLETPGTMPKHWFVAEVNVPVLVDDHDAIKVEEEWHEAR